ncbi:MAG: hypothetical protein ABIF12_00125 [bacterium]
MNKKILLTILLSILYHSASYSMQIVNSEETKAPKTKIKLKIKINPEDAHTKGKEYYRDKNYEFSFQYFKYAAKRDHLESQLEFATMLSEGLGCEKDLTKAIKWTNIVMKKTNNKDDTDLKMLNRVAKTVWQDIVTKMLSELQETTLAIPRQLLSALLGAQKEEEEEDNDNDNGKEMTEVVRNMFI